MCLAIPGELVERTTQGGLAMGTVDFSGLRREVCLEYTPEASLGDYVLVHVGFALRVLDPAEARRTLELLDELGAQLQEELGGGDGAGGGGPS